MTIAEFRKTVKTQFPHVKVSVRTVSFSDLARAEAKCLTIRGAETASQFAFINQLAKEAGILPDGSVRFHDAS